MTETPTAKPGPGAMLRAAREKQGLHIAALAAAIKVAPRKLDALENDRWDELPDATFVRALAQTVCRTLKIDAQPVLAALPPPGVVALETRGSGLNTPFHDRPGSDGLRLSAQAIRPMVWAAGALMLAALLVYFVPSTFWTSAPVPHALAAAPAEAPAVELAGHPETPSPLDLASAPAEGEAPVLTNPSPEPVVLKAPDAPASQGLRALPVPSSSPAGKVAVVAVVPVVPVVPVPATSATVAPAGAPAAAAASVPSLNASAGPVQLRVSEPSWIEVHDAEGALLVSRILQPGEKLGLSGKLPIQLVIGNASATQLAFRGHPVDLAPSTRDNVAHVELQ